MQVIHYKCGSVLENAVNLLFCSSRQTVERESDHCSSFLLLIIKIHQQTWLEIFNKIFHLQNFLNIKSSSWEVIKYQPILVNHQLYYDITAQNVSRNKSKINSPCRLRTCSGSKTFLMSVSRYRCLINVPKNLLMMRLF